MSKLVGCKKGVQRGFYSFICGNNYSGKQVICEACTEKANKAVDDASITKEDLLLILDIIMELEDHTQLKEAEEVLKAKVRRMIV